jgi:hypothetical protein
MSLVIVSEHGVVHRDSCPSVARAAKVKPVTPLQARVYQLPACYQCLTTVDYQRITRVAVSA